MHFQFLIYARQALELNIDTQMQTGWQIDFQREYKLRMHDALQTYIEDFYDRQKCLMPSQSTQTSSKLEVSDFANRPSEEILIAIEENDDIHPSQL